MRILIQRSLQSSVSIHNEVVGSITHGYVLLVGISTDDTIEDVQYCARKVINMRLFEDAEGKINLPLSAVDGQILSISQFTLYGNVVKGNRPSFINAGRPEHAEPLYESFNNLLREAGITVATGQFGADMQVSIVNDGPVTIWVDSRER